MPLQDPVQIAQRVRKFIEREPVCVADKPRAAKSGFSKAAVAESFGRAARGYDKSARLQREVGARLLARMEPLPVCAARVLDLGCGTAFFRDSLLASFPGASYIGLDLSIGMLDYARQARGIESCWVAGDAEQLPLATGSVDVVFSSLAIQWCQQPQQLFSELRRVLKPGGRVYFSTLGPNTLCELRQAWASVDERPHVNRFASALELKQAAGAAGRWALESETLCLHYRRVRELTNELKGIGAHNLNSGRAEGLGGRRRLAAMVQAYEAFRTEGFLPATYEVYFGSFEKS